MNWIANLAEQICLFQKSDIETWLLKNGVTLDNIDEYEVWHKFPENKHTLRKEGKDISSITIKLEWNEYYKLIRREWQPFINEKT